MNHDWSNLPKRFEYLIPIADKYFIHDDGRLYKEMVKHLRSDELEDLATLYREIESRNDGSEIARWLDRAFRDGAVEEGALGPVTDLMGVFGLLARKGIEPFASGRAMFDFEEPRDWQKLPIYLTYLIAPAEKYGDIQFDDQIDEFLEKITSEQFAELSALAAEIRRRGDTDAINTWRQEYPSVDHPEGSRVTWLLNLLTQLDLDWWTAKSPPRSLEGETGTHLDTRK